MLSPFLIFSKGGEHKFIEFACLYCISKRAAIKLKCVFMKRFVAFLNRIPIVFFFFFFFFFFATPTQKSLPNLKVENFL